ncbi:MAG: adenylate/guanylate cyclase domain-containing protein [Armatimonadetes bacterium]|nr:adenylate/guanylate cyclase domain-containing protein [Armatimonadota bacterium]
MFSAIAISLAAALGGGWALFHPRALWSVRGVLGRWSFVLTLALILPLAVLLPDVLAMLSGPVADGLLFLVTLFATPFLFGLLVTLGVCAAGLGGLVGGKGPTAARSASAAAGALWPVLALLAGGDLLASSHGGSPPREWLYGVAPILVALAGRLQRTEAGSLLHPLGRTAALLGRCFIFNRKRGERSRRVDLRGAALGGLVGAACFWLGALGMFAPLQRIATAAGAAASPMVQMASDGAKRDARGRIVLMHADAAALQRAFGGGSVSAVQASMVADLTRLGAAAIVLPLPAMSPPSDIAVSGLLGRADRPPTQAADAAKNRRDAPLLAAAVRRSRRVVLTVPPPALLGHGENVAISLGGARQSLSERTDASAQQAGLAPADAAAAVGVERTHLWSPDRLDAPLAASIGRRYAPASAQVARALAQAMGVRLHIPREAALPAMVSPPEQAGFAELPYSAVAGPEAVQYVPLPVKEDAPPSGRWRSAADFVRGKVVILDSFRPRVVNTPLGQMTLQEAMANEAVALASGSVSKQLPGWLTWLLVVLPAAFVGHLGLRRGPAEAGWAAGGLVASMLLAGLAVTSLSRVVADPVTPVMATVVSLVVATRFSFGEERKRRDRNRQLLERFVSAELVGQYVDDPEQALGLRGQRGFVAVLFADARNFSGYAERHSPETVVATVNRYMSVMTERLHGHGGILDKFTGDGLMALFRSAGDPRAAAAASVRAALAMSEAAVALSLRLEAEGRTPLQFGFGVHCGDAVVGLVGDPERQVNYTALGLTVVVSARLQGLASAGEVVVSEDARRLTDGLFTFTPREPVEVKGLTGAMQTYVAGAAAPPSLVASAPHTIAARP